MIAHIHVNWLAPVKVRRTLIGGSKKMIVYDDLEPSEKIKVYDKGITLNRQQDPWRRCTRRLVGYRTGDMLAPNLDMSEALRVEAAHFVRCVEEKKHAHHRRTRRPPGRADPGGGHRIHAPQGPARRPAGGGSPVADDPISFPGVTR